MVPQRSSIVLLLILTLYSCPSRIERESLEGIWELYNSSLEDPAAYVFEITNDQIVYLDRYDFPRKSIFHVAGDELLFNGPFGKPRSILIQSLNVDTLITRDSLLYLRNRGWEKSEVYLLIGLRSDQLLSEQRLGSFLHYYSINDSVRLKYGGMLRPIEHLFLTRSDRYRHYSLNIFVGSEVKLLELKTLYAYLYALGLERVNIIVNYNEAYRYEIIEVTLDLWQNESDELINRFYAPPPRPIEREFAFREDFLKTNPELLHINTLEQLKKIDNPRSDNINYLVSIDGQLSVREYLIIKTRLNQLLENKNNVLKYEIL